MSNSIGLADVVVTDCSVRIVDLEIPVKEVADFFNSVPQEERPFVMIKAVEVGTFCLERGRTAQDTEFVKRQIDALLSNVEREVSDIPTKTQSALISKLGTQDGQVLAPVRDLLEHVSRETTNKINEVKNLLSQDLDPSKAGGPAYHLEGAPSKPGLLGWGGSVIFTRNRIPIRSRLLPVHSDSISSTPSTPVA